MKERILVLVLTYAAILVYELIHRKTETASRDRLLYVILLVVSAYLSFDFIVNKDWPDTYDFIPSFIKVLAKEIDSFLSVKMS